MPEEHFVVDFFGVAGVLVVFFHFEGLDEFEVVVVVG